MGNSEVGLSSVRILIQNGEIETVAKHLGEIETHKNFDI